jgi:hypothetical protein
MDLMIIDGAEQ